MSSWATRSTDVAAAISSAGASDPQRCTQVSWATLIGSNGKGVDGATGEGYDPARARTGTACQAETRTIRSSRTPSPGSVLVVPSGSKPSRR
ncbi:hypothetical protein GCM10025862_22560 [Arsenicicoccus piscis]|uniref:Uncharacterized protein n=1 Tax=Arsenicicoccus piscis TaxID=673954 RepID=A0ABQ6HRP7_9MICO|nr:hypothetical protein GCM10025862_22560 [Arsenicicoccus piscis]